MVVVIVSLVIVSPKIALSYQNDGLYMVKLARKLGNNPYNHAHITSYNHLLLELHAQVIANF